MTPKQAQHILGKIKYKPNFSISSEIQPEQKMLRVLMKLDSVIDAYDHRKFTQLYGNWLLPFTELRMHDVRSFLYEIRKQIQRMELHEVDEFLEIESNKVFDPHNPDRTKFEMSSKKIELELYYFDSLSQQERIK